jgi:hypothetical protein
MSETDQKKYASLATEMGLEGKEKIDFVREQLAADRQERAYERDKAREAEVERQGAETLRQKLEIEERSRIEILKIELAREQAQRDDEFRLAQLQYTAHQSNSQNINVNNEDGRGDQFYSRQHRIDIGKWKEGTDLQAFITQFETLAKAYKLRDDLYCVEFVRALDGEALHVYEALSVESRLNYHEVIKALKHHYRLTESGYRQKFKTSRINASEGQKEFAARIRKYLRNWLELAGYEQTYEGLEELIVRDAYFLAQPQPVQIYLREAGKLRLNELTVRAQNYCEAHNIREGHDMNGSKQNWSKNHLQSNDGIPRKGMSPAVSGNVQNHNKGYGGNMTRPCGSNDRGHGRHNSSNDKEYREKMNKGEIRCFNCGVVGHKSFQCTRGLKQGHGTGQGYEPKRFDQTAACQAVVPIMQSDGVNVAERYIRIPGDSESLPVVAAVRDYENCVENTNYNVHQSLIGEAWCNNIPCSYMRDTGSTISICRDIFVDDIQYTGRKITCALVDGCIRTFPEALVRLESPYYTGDLNVAVIPTALHEFIIGNE